jgi:hypothetical protein
MNECCNAISAERWRMPALGEGEIEGVWTIRGKEGRDEMSLSMQILPLYPTNRGKDMWN